MNKKTFDRLKAGLDEAVAVSRGDPAAVKNVRVTPSCGCVFCDLNLPTYRDERGYYHEGPEDERITCEVAINEQ